MPTRLHFREFGDLLASHELHVGFLPVRAVTGESSAAAQLAFESRGSDFFHFYVEQFLDRLLHHDLVGVFRHLEAKSSVVILGCDAFFGDERPHQSIVNGHYFSASALCLGADFASVSLSFEAAACVNSTRVASSS